MPHTGRVQVVRGLRAEVGSIKQVTLRKSHNVKNNSKNKALTLSAQSGTTVPNFFVFLLNFACMPHCPIILKSLSLDSAQSQLLGEKKT